MIDNTPHRGKAKEKLQPFRAATTTDLQFYTPTRTKNYANEVMKNYVRLQEWVCV